MLEFKEKTSARSGGFDNEDKRILSKSLSGFANSAGGILIWGIRARKGADNVDCAQELKPIQDIERFHAEALSLSSQLVMPRLDGVRLGLIKSGTDKGAGYLVLEVLRSERRPHRGEASGDKQYWKRIGESFFAMEHYDIEDAFSRRASPLFEIDTQWRRSNPIYGPDGAQYRKILQLKITNSGHVTAKSPYVSIARIDGISPKIKNSPEYDKNIKELISGQQLMLDDPKHNNIHPGITWTVDLFSVTIRERNGEEYVIDDIEISPTFTIYYGCGCEDMRPMLGDITVDF